jgi:hypothetical protein
MTMTLNPIDYLLSEETNMDPQVVARDFLDNFDPKFMPERLIDGTVGCPVCGRTTKPQGFMPHWKSHRADAERTLGLPVTPSRSGRIKQTEVERKVKPKPEPIIEIPLDEALAAAMAYILGDAKLTIDQALELHTWLVESEQLIRRIRGR